LAHRGPLRDAGGAAHSRGWAKVAGFNLDLLRPKPKRRLATGGVHV
jgi:hypothetical protein